VQVRHKNESEPQGGLNSAGAFIGKVSCIDILGNSIASVSDSGGRRIRPVPCFDLKPYGWARTTRPCWRISLGTGSGFLRSLPITCASVFMKMHSMCSRDNSLKDEIISEHVHLIWFDSIPEYLVNWHLTAIGRGTLPCILVENF
jgi:hypothetical protein